MRVSNDKALDHYGTASEHAAAGGIGVAKTEAKMERVLKIADSPSARSWLAAS